MNGLNYSRVKPDLQYNQNTFLVCLASGGGILGGHAIITVEGLLADGTLFERVCDITAGPAPDEKPSPLQDSFGNQQGVITKIRLYSGFQAGVDYTGLNSNSWYTTSAKVMKLVASIEAKKQELEDSLAANKPSPFKYQTAGSRRWFGFGGNGGDNCLTWTQRELIQANILTEGEAVKVIDIVKAPPNLHISGQHHP